MREDDVVLALVGEPEWVRRRRVEYLRGTGNVVMHPEGVHRAWASGSVHAKSHDQDMVVLREPDIRSDTAGPVGFVGSVEPEMDVKPPLCETWKPWTLPLSSFST